MPTLLVTYRGVNRAGDNRAVVRLGGFFLTGAPKGNARTAPQFVCDTARWHVVRAERAPIMSPVARPRPTPPRRRCVVVVPPARRERLLALDFFRG